MNPFSNKKDDSVRGEIGLFSNWAIGRAWNDETINAGANSPQVVHRTSEASQEQSFWRWVRDETNTAEETALNRAIQSEGAPQTSNELLASILGAPPSTPGHAASACSPEDNKAFLQWMRDGGGDNEDTMAMNQSYWQPEAKSRVNDTLTADDGGNTSKARLAADPEDDHDPYSGDETEDKELESFNSPVISSIFTYPNNEPNPQASSHNSQWGFTIAAANATDDETEDEELSSFNSPASSIFTYPNSEPNPQASSTERETSQWGFDIARANPIEDDAYAYEDESDAALAVALHNYDTFYNLKPGTASVAILEHTSAGIAGWASCVLNETPNKPMGQTSYKQDLKPETVSSPPTKSPPRRIGDDEESRELQMALLESVGVNVGREAKLSCIHDTGPLVDTSNASNESDDEDNWSVEDDGFEDEQETVSLQSDALDEEGGGNEDTGLSIPLAKRLRLGGTEDDDQSDDTAPSFIVVQPTDGGDETGLSSSASDSEAESEGTAESFVRVSSQDSSSASDDWAML